MRKVYKICVEDPEKENVENAFKHLGVTEDTRLLHGDAGDRVEYVVSLSKYELLYLRLSCKSGTLKNITAAKKKIK